jgi:hypothetical protein
VQRLREENRRPNTRSTYSKCWRLWRVSAGASRRTPSPYGSDADGAGTGVVCPARLGGRRAGVGEEGDPVPHRRRPLHPASEATEDSARRGRREETKDGGGASGEAAEKEEKEELEDAEASESDPVEVVDLGLMTTVWIC